jgi:4-hydroxy-2-oxoheptanedioate aldolase
VCLLVQVETASALQQLDEIAAVDGVDGVFIGPADLSASMGHLGNASHPDVLRAIDGAIARILAAGKAPGILALDVAFARHCIALGARFVAVGVEATMLARAARELAAQFKTEGGAGAPGSSGY